MPSNNGKPKTALVTGVTGQDGSYLVELLLAKGYDVWGIVRRSSSISTGRIEHLLPAGDEAESRFKLRYGDLADASSLLRIVAESRPDEVYNLAAQSHVKVSFDVPEYTGNVTGLGAVRLLSAIHELGLNARFYQASSSELFGNADESPRSEKSPFWPRSPYGAAKAYAFHSTRNFRESYGMFAVNGILFNHESPRRGETFVTRKISLAAARIKLGLQERVALGNLDAKRDWGYAGDYIEGMWLMMQADTPEDYVLATGQAHSVREFCELCFDEIGLPLTWRGAGDQEQGVDPNGQVRVTVDPEYYRPAEVDALVGDASKARRQLGWEPTVSLPELAQMMVGHDLHEQEKRSQPQTSSALSD